MFKYSQHQLQQYYQHQGSYYPCSPNQCHPTHCARKRFRALFGTRQSTPLRTMTHPNWTLNSSYNTKWAPILPDFTMRIPAPLPRSLTGDRLPTITSYIPITDSAVVQHPGGCKTSSASSSGTETSFALRLPGRLKPQLLLQYLHGT